MGPIKKCWGEDMALFLGAASLAGRGRGWGSLGTHLGLPGGPCEVACGAPCVHLHVVPGPPKRQGSTTQDRAGI